jgi:hypothetical protein
MAANLVTLERIYQETLHIQCLYVLCYTVLSFFPPGNDFGPMKACCLRPQALRPWSLTFEHSLRCAHGLAH